MDRIAEIDRELLSLERRMLSDRSPNFETYRTLRRNLEIEKASLQNIHTVCDSVADRVEDWKAKARGDRPC